MARGPVRVTSDLDRKHRTRAHEQVLSGLLEQFLPVFAHSPDGVYLYLDDTHKVCNKRLADMFGMTVEEWRKVPDFLDRFVAPSDRELVATNFRQHVTGLSRPATFRFHALRKNGETFLAETEMIPVSWNGHAVAYHFVREIGKAS